MSINTASTALLAASFGLAAPANAAMLVQSLSPATAPSCPSLLTSSIPDAIQAPFKSTAADFAGVDIGADSPPAFPSFEADQVRLAADHAFGPVIGASTIGGVPEPAVWLLLIAGFAVAGFVLRRGQSEGRTASVHIA